MRHRPASRANATLQIRAGRILNDMRIDARSIESRYQNGNALRMSGNFAAAEQEFRGVLAIAPTHRDAAYSLAFMLREQGRTNTASQVVSVWWQSSKSDADATLSAIGFLIECSSYESADEIVRASVQRWPRDARLAGELVDTKCYAGAMNPGEGKVHKDCGALCVLGGIPPLFVMRGAGRDPAWYIVADPQGGPLGKDSASFIGDSLELSGRIVEAPGYRLFEIETLEALR